MQHLKEARAKKLDAFIRNKKLIINGKEYTPGKLVENEKNADKKIEREEVDKTEAEKQGNLDKLPKNNYFSGQLSGSQTENIGDVHENRKISSITEKTGNSSKYNLHLVAEPRTRLRSTSKFKSNGE